MEHAPLVPIDSHLLEEDPEELFEDAPCGYLTMLPDGGIVKVNQTFLSWTGFERTLLMGGMRFQQLLTMPGRIYYDTHVGPLLQMQGHVHEVAFDIARPGSSPLAVILNAVLKKDAEGRPVLIRLTVFDATQRRQYERELLLARQLADQAVQSERSAREAAERANRAKDEFLALVSHELRTPLGVILGWSQILRKTLPAKADAERALTVIERNTRAQVRLVDDLLDMGRMLSGKLRLDVQRVDLGGVVEAAVDSVEPAALARGLRLQKVIDSAATVAGDAGRLQQVFWNLLTNAVKFTPKGGSVRVVMSRVDSHAEVSVIDNGQGMSAEFLMHAFERFRQADSAVTRGTSGLGLGLSLVKYLVEMHGGTIGAFSEGEGRGATFTVKLPVAAIQPGEEACDVPSAPAVSGRVKEGLDISLAGVKILVVENDRDGRELLWHTLTERGAEVVSAASAQEALATLKQLQPDVLISDISLPQEDGYELIRRVRMLGEGLGRVPAVALTARSRLEDRTCALLAGYQIHLAKPADARELIVTVASLAGRLEPRGSSLP